MTAIAGEKCYRCGQHLWGKPDSECPTCIRRGLIDAPKKKLRVLEMEFIQTSTQSRNGEFRNSLTAYECKLPSVARTIVLYRDTAYKLAEKLAKGLPADDTPGWLAAFKNDLAAAAPFTWKETPEEAVRALEQWVKDETWHRRQQVVNFEKLAEAMGVRV